MNMRATYLARYCFLEWIGLSDFCFKFSKLSLIFLPVKFVKCYQNPRNPNSLKLSLEETLLNLKKIRQSVLRKKNTQY